MTIIADQDSALANSMRCAVGDGLLVPTLDSLHRHLAVRPFEDTIVLGPSVDAPGAFRLAESLRVSRPGLGVILVRKTIDAAVLTEALRSGIRDVVEVRDLTGLRDAVERSRNLANEIQQRVDDTAGPGEAPRGRIVTVFSAKGGCGKTTLATNLAAALADGGRRQVCLVDLDLAFGDIAIALHLFPSHTIADAVAMSETLDLPTLQRLLTHHSRGLNALVAPVDPSSAESVPAPLVTKILEVLRGEYDFVIVDTPAAFNDHVLAAFDQSDLIALIATLDVLALKNLKLATDIMDLLNYPRERTQVVLNRADTKVGLVVSDAEKALGTPIAAQIPSSREVPSSINRGVTIVTDDPRHPVSVAIRLFAEEQVARGLASSGEDTLLAPGAGAERRRFRRRRSRVA
jgi:pilus assembly protein CpaE